MPAKRSRPLPEGDWCLYYGQLWNIGDIRRLSDSEFEAFKAERIKEKNEQQKAEFAKINRDWEQGVMHTEQPGFVYIAEAAGFIKIGISRQPKQRLKSLNHCSPKQVKMLKIRQCKDATGTKARLQELYRKFRTQGEWFKLPPTVLKELLSTLDRV